MDKNDVLVKATDQIEQPKYCKTCCETKKQLKQIMNSDHPLAEKLSEAMNNGPAGIEFANGKIIGFGTGEQK